MSARRSTICVAVVLLLAVACGGESDEPEASEPAADALPITVTAKNFKFNPDSLEGHATHTLDLTFVNEDDTAHTFTIDEMDVDVEASGEQEAQTTFTPEETGTFEFYCRYHPDTMKGEFEVS